MPAMRALVAGATGLVGRRIAAHLAARGDCEVVGLSRRGSDVALDLLDRDAVRALADKLAGTTHLFFATRAPRPDNDDERATNLAMLANLVEALEPVSPALAHVGLVHGTKWYGSHLGPYPTPARETDPRGPRMFYHDQLDWLAARQAGKAWSWSTLRPHIVCAAEPGPFSLVSTLAAYATLCRETGRPLTFPGTQACFRSVSQATDADLLARAAIWSATAPAGRNQSFNVVNADYFRWCNLWPAVAELFGLEPGGVETRSLVPEFEAGEALWQRLVRREGLRPSRLRDVASAAFADFLFRADWDDMSSTAALRRCGFGEVVETEPMLLAQLAELRRRKLVP